MVLEGRRVVITGAASGIGRATAELMATEGAKIVIGDVNQAGADETVGAIREKGRAAWFLRTDVSDAAQVKSLLVKAQEEMGGIDIIVNNAGLQRSGAVTDFDEADWDALMQVNPRSVFLFAKYGVPYLRRSTAAVILNTASIAGLRGGGGLTAYSASKGAIVAFSRALALELAPDRIRVNCICPGWVDTPFNNPAIEFMGGRDKQAELVKNSVPMGRQGMPSEIAPAMVFLVSDAASFITGQAFVIDGGQI